MKSGCVLKGKWKVCERSGKKVGVGRDRKGNLCVYMLVVRQEKGLLIAAVCFALETRGYP